MLLALAPIKSCIHYKFTAKLNYDMVTFNGLHISLCNLWHWIMGCEKLKAANCNLQITTAQTKEGAWGWGARSLRDRPVGLTLWWPQPVGTMLCSLWVVPM